MKPLYTFSAAEAVAWVAEMERSLVEHADRLLIARDPPSVRAAMDTHLLLLGEMATVHPELGTEIAELIERYQRNPVTPR